jgi:serine/threonine-protein kinase RsbT
VTTLTGEQPDTLQLRSDTDVVLARRRVRERAQGIDLDLVIQTKIVTAASELARNTVIHGHGGEVTIEVVRDDAARLPRVGLRLHFRDEGPGIADLPLALGGGWSSGKGLGLGLSGSRRLVHEFDIDSVPGVGTRVTVLVWRRPT